MAVQTITYDDKQYLNQNSSIADVNKCNDTDLNEIKSVVNNNAQILQNSILYSTNETNTGKVWLNNKPIYSQTILVSSPSTLNEWITIASVPYETLINIHGVLISSTGRYVSINHSEPNYEIATSTINGDVQMKLSYNGWASRQVIMFVEYTKTTD